MTDVIRGAAVVVLGVGAMVVRSLTDVVSRWWPSTVAEEPRHNAGRVHEQVKAAQQAARAAGVLRR